MHTCEVVGVRMGQEIVQRESARLWMLLVRKVVDPEEGEPVDCGVFGLVSASLPAWSEQCTHSIRRAST